MAFAAQPGTGGKQYQHGEDFQTAHQHIKAEHQLDQRRKIRKADHRADQFQTGADVVQAGCHRGKSSNQVKLVDGHHHGGQHKNDQVEVHVGAHAKHRFIVQGLALKPDGSDSMGVQHPH